MVARGEAAQRAVGVRAERVCVGVCGGRGGDRSDGDDWVEQCLGMGSGFWRGRASSTVLVDAIVSSTVESV